jgi:hypothetical protein
VVGEGGPLPAVPEALTRGPEGSGYQPRGTCCSMAENGTPHPFRVGGRRTRLVRSGMEPDSKALVRRAAQITGRTVAVRDVLRRNEDAELEARHRAERAALWERIERVPTSSTGRPAS